MKSEIRNPKSERIPGASYGNDICCFEISSWPRRIFPLQSFSTLINTPLQRGGGCDYALDEPFQRFLAAFPGRKLQEWLRGFLRTSKFGFVSTFEFRGSDFLLPNPAHD
jgi:hypothetical protein